MDSLNLEKKGLYKVKELKNYKILKPYSDVIGWNVFSIDKKSIGIIEDILVNPELKKIRYIDIYLHNNIKIKSGIRHLFVPVDMIKLDLINRAAYSLNLKTILSLRKIEPGENGINDSQDDTTNQNDLPQMDSLYNNKLFDESNFHKSDERKLYKLKELDDSEIFESFPDIRNWCVMTSDKINIGQIDDLLIEKDSHKVRYLSVKIYAGPIFNDERHILLPIGLAELGVNDNNNIIIKIDSNNFVNYPPYNGEAISDYENSLKNSFNNNPPEYM